MSLHGQRLQRSPACQRSQSPGPRFLSGKVYILRNYYTELHPQSFPIGHSTPGCTLRCETLLFGDRRAPRNSRIAGRWPTKVFGGCKSMRRWIAWTASMLAGAFCFYPGLRMLWFGHWNESKGGWGTKRVHKRSLSGAAATYWVGSSVGNDAKLRPLTYRSNHPVSLAFSSSRKRRPKTAFAYVAQHCERRVASPQPPLVVTFA